MRAALAFAVAAALVGCGDDDGGGGGAGGGGARPPPPAAKPDSKNKLTGRQHIEDMVACTPPEKSTGPACEPLEAVGSGAPAAHKVLADCAPGLYCMAVGHAFSCEKCPERDAIRHEFSDRDFVTDQARDPFYNFVIAPIGVGDNTSKPKPEPHQSCRRSDQFVASNYSYQDLKPVGIVSQRTMRKAMMLDTAGVGHIIKRGDCVGKEKAVVKDIGAGYITFVVEEDPDSKRPSQETSMQLHPNTQATDTPPPEIAPDTSAPVVAPPVGPRTGLGQSNTPPQAPPQRQP
jgi:Tfp pilus assembly protein PilP